MSNGQMLCMGRSGGDPLLGFSVDESDSSDDIGDALVTQEPTLSFLRAQAHRGKGGLDRIRRSQVRPVLGREGRISDSCPQGSL
jgi:hypothetical protein